MNRFCLPLKMFHGVDFKDDMPQEDIIKTLNEFFDYIQSKGFGGIVANVASRDYLKNESLWNSFGLMLKVAKERNIRVWIYDENGYPSGTAGGETLKSNPDLEARAVVMMHTFVKPGDTYTFEFPRGHEYSLSAYSYKVEDEDITFLDADNFYKEYNVYGKTDNLTVINDCNSMLFVSMFIKKRAYEGTHAEHNCCECRRYIDITNVEATKEFISNTYEQYTKRFSNYFSGENRENGVVEAFFTDEPSLMGVYINPTLYPYLVRDQYDDTIPLYPITTWAHNIDKYFHEKHNIDVYKYLIYLFGVDTEKASEFRGMWYDAITDITEHSFYKELSQYCEKSGIPFSGHILLEDDIRDHPKFEGNYFSYLRNMHYPGIDMLFSIPEIVYKMSFTPLLISSIARSYGRKHVMSEVSGHAEGGNITIDQMLSSVILQFAFGVDVFNSYYSDSMVPADEYKKYNHVIGDTIDKLKGKDIKPIALYYPIETININTVVDVDGLKKDGNIIEKRDACAKSLNSVISAFNNNQIPFSMIDLNLLKESRVVDGKLVLPIGVQYEVLVISECNINKELNDELIRLNRDGLEIIPIGNQIFTECSKEIPKTNIDELIKKLIKFKPINISSVDGVAARYTADGDLYVLLVNSNNYMVEIENNDELNLVYSSFDSVTIQNNTIRIPAYSHAILNKGTE